MDEEYWNLDQALAWVVWRDFSIVEAIKTPQNGNTSFGTYVFYPPCERQITESADLLNALRAGKIIARGCKKRKDDRIQIHMETWQDLEISSLPNQESYAKPNHKTGRCQASCHVKFLN